jgi:hypothetical protein
MSYAAQPQVRLCAPAESGAREPPVWVATPEAQTLLGERQVLTGPVLRKAAQALVSPVLA